MTVPPTRCYGCGEPDATCQCGSWISLACPEPHRAWLAREIALASAADENANNFRAARVGYPDEMAAYEEARARGCCVAQEIACRHPDGTVYLLGWNYGH